MNVKNDSANFHTGGVVLLAMSVVFCGLAFALVIPLLRGNANLTLSFLQQTEPPQPRIAADNAAAEFDEFYPSGPVAGGREQRPQTVVAQPVVHSTPEAVTASQSSSPVAKTAQQQLANPPVDSSTVTAVHQVATEQFQPQSSQMPYAQAMVPPALPSGSVYAPVTVNLDSSLLAGQMQAIESRLNQLSQPQTQEVTKRVAEAPRRRRPKQRSRDDEEVTRELAKIGDGFEKLAMSFHDLRHQTDLRLKEVSNQADRAEVAAQVIEAYRKALAEDEKPPAKPPTNVAMANTPTPVPVFIVPQASPNKSEEPSTPQFVIPSPQSPELAPVKAEPASEVGPTLQDITVAPASSEFEFDSGEAAQKATTRNLMASEDDFQFFDIEALTPEDIPVIDESSDNKSLPWQPVPPPIPARSFEGLDVSPVNETEATPKSGSPSGFSSTYRFRMAVDEDEVTESSAHKSQKKFKVVQVAGATDEVKDVAVAQSADMSNVQKQPGKGPVKDLRRSTRNAGRGLNRKIIGPRPGDEPGLRLSFPSMTKSPTEPSILKRMSSGIRQLGRSLE